jgi:adenosylmethionine-8-amino-7-oxononanoate aminotransferase
MAEFEAAARTFVAGKGNYLFDVRGRRVFDAISSVWTTLHGHCHPHIVEAIATQARTLDHSTLLGATHPRAEELAERLSDLTGLPFAFFSSDGASAIEVALKMALQYWQNAGDPQRTRFVHLTDAYHGDTAGAMSVSDIALFKSRFGAITFESRSLDETADDDHVAAFIVEPIVQAAAGMRIIPAHRYERLKNRSALLIVDEVATGFGRTGAMFASEGLHLRPDLVCLGKSITGGTLALSATLANEAIYTAFLGSHDQRKHLFHGHSYAGNPIACAAALANLELFEREQPLEQVAELAPALLSRLQALTTLPAVKDVRGAGLMFGVELDARGSAWAVADALFERGYFTRPIGDVIQFVPPLTTTEVEGTGFCASLEEILKA